LLRTSFLTNRGVITGFGEVDLLSSSTSQNYGRLEADGGRLLVGGTSAGLLQNNGIIAADGSELEFARLVTNILSGLTAPQITLRDGTIRFPLIGTSQSGLNNDGILAAIGGVDDVFGRISNTSNGNIAVTNDSVLTFHHDVTSSGGTVSVFPGSKAIFLQDLTMSGGALLLADLAGTNSTTGFGRVEVVGHAQLNSASLQVTLSDGYTPKAGDTFSLVAAAGGIQGMPTLGQMPSLPTGLMWHLNVDAHRVELNVVTPVAGDYNGNGIVDAADYTMWRDSLGQIGPGLAADGNHDSIVNSHDYDVWSANFGTIAGGGTAAMSPSPVEAPEPSACVLGIVGVAVVIGRLISHQRL
jgi:hypothetical protein